MVLLSPSATTNLLHATAAWEVIAKNIVTGKTVQQAVDAGNARMVLFGFPERWQVIGDNSVRIKP